MIIESLMSFIWKKIELIDTLMIIIFQNKM